MPELALKVRAVETAAVLFALVPGVMTMVIGIRPDVHRFIIRTEVGKSSVVGPETARSRGRQIRRHLLHSLDIRRLGLALDGLRLFVVFRRHQRHE